MTFLKVTPIIQQNLVLHKQKSNLHHKIHQPSKSGMLQPNLSSEIQHFLKTLIFGYSKNGTQFLTVIFIQNVLWLIKSCSFLWNLLCFFGFYFEPFFILLCFEWMVKINMHWDRVFSLHNRLLYVFLFLLFL